MSCLLTVTAPAWSYRPFESTDADVVDRGETEIELGPDDGFGFEGIVIASGKLADLTYHLNAGGGVTRSDNRTFGVWGVIVERPASRALTVVAEVNGESIEGESPDSSALVGFIWEPPASAITFDGAIRKGISSEAPDWGLTFGLTFSLR